MISKQDVDQLATLARIDIPEEEKAKLQKDLEAVLGYVSELNSAEPDAALRAKDELINVMRVDGLGHEPGAFTDDLLAAAPESQDGYLVVRQIIEK